MPPGRVGKSPTRPEDGGLGRIPTVRARVVSADHGDREAAGAERAERTGPVTNLRLILLVVVFIGLAGLEVGHGLRSLDAVRRRSHAELLGTTIERAQDDLANALAKLIEEPRDHARYLSSVPALAQFLLEPDVDPTPRAEVERHLRSYLFTYRAIDRVRVLDLEGREWIRCERIGTAGGVGTIPPALLSPKRDVELLDLARTLEPGEIGRTPLVIDRERVEVPPSQRQVFHYVAGVGGQYGELPRLGSLVLTVYAAPLLERVREFAPIDGIEAFLIDSDGRYLAHSARYRERPGGSDLRRDHPAVAESLLSGDERAVEDSTHFLSRPVGDRIGWRFVVAVPTSALDAAAGGLRAESRGVIGSMVLVIVALAAVAVIFVRVSRRAIRLEEEKQQQELERRLQISERIGALGLITAGVAHEINNPLEGIGNYLALLERDGVSPEKRREYLENVRLGFARIRDIVRDLSSVSRPPSGDTSADLARIVDRALTLGRYDPQLRQVAVERVGLDAPLPLPGDSGRLEQVVLNLFLNAGRAMRGEGTIRVVARRVGGSDRPALELAVEDEGPGIPSDHLERLFDPFFTTGPEGLGLGLAISRGIMSAHGGSIAAANRAEGGARFVLRLPAGPPPPPRPRGRYDDPTHRPGRR